MKKISILLFILLTLNVKVFCQDLVSSSSGRAYVTGMSIADINTVTDYQFTRTGIEAPSSIANVPQGNIYDFRIFPNPAQYDLTLQLPAGNLYNVSIIDTKGKLVMDQSDLHDQVRINIQDIPSGDYYVRITGSSGVFSKRIRKQ
jgi:hypothetical protein